MWVPGGGPAGLRSLSVKTPTPVLGDCKGGNGGLLLIDANLDCDCDQPGCGGEACTEYELETASVVDVDPGLITCCEDITATPCSPVIKRITRQYICDGVTNRACEGFGCGALFPYSEQQNNGQNHAYRPRRTIEVTWDCSQCRDGGGCGGACCVRINPQQILDWIEQSGLDVGENPDPAGGVCLEKPCNVCCSDS